MFQIVEPAPFSDLRYASKNKASILLTEGRAILTKGVIHDKRKIQKKEHNALNG
ncbi:hypothetical protein [Vibrio vulnificus YJ016]|uniref:Uncharacterized protein n=1 Tax=Vibrio vulnificus (strain YJ016) TaxID=196600 RepID=Q7MI05_VIBVY|nr:hypothetical protein VVMO6_00591 [Vibrio vulnificus MO6-24/O]ALM70003.1 hypothetical protein FORC9_0486 [Vibrio vulnificus]BAC95476.1 hypothetical protein [Vibrio vulnificus YJ016]ANH64192.1 hypothetical protein FORC16_2309 [Vibrio vulnificus]ARN66843.1 hypothetical protein FORC36_2326 [Vibrio vulnificus]